MSKVILKTKITNNNNGRNLSYIGESGLWLEKGETQLIDGAYPSACRNEQCQADMQAELDARFIEVKLVTNLPIEKKKESYRFVRPAKTDKPVDVTPEPAAQAFVDNAQKTKEKPSKTVVAGDNRLVKVSQTKEGEKTPTVKHNGKDQKVRNLIPETEADKAENAKVAAKEAEQGTKGIFTEAAVQESEKEAIFTNADKDSPKGTVTANKKLPGQKTDATTVKEGATVTKKPATRKTTAKKPAPAKKTAAKKTTTAKKTAAKKPATKKPTSSK